MTAYFWKNRIQNNFQASEEGNDKIWGQSWVFIIIISSTLKLQTQRCLYAPLLSTWTLRKSWYIYTVGRAASYQTILCLSLICLFRESLSCCYLRVFPGGSDGKASGYNAGDPGLIPGSGRSSGEGNGNPLQYSCLKIPWMEEPGRLQSMGSKRFRHDWVTSLHFGQPREAWTEAASLAEADLPWS